MAEYSGSALYVNWTSSAGTVVLSTDYRTLNDDPDGELIEVTAGADANKTFLPSVKSGKVSLNYLDQTSGTATTKALAFGVQGTLVYGPEGTAAGAPKVTIPAIALGAKRALQYAGATEVSTEFQYNGARVDANY